VRGIPRSIRCPGSWVGDRNGPSPSHARRPGSPPALPALLPLPAGEGRGEGERISAQPVANRFARGSGVWKLGTQELRNGDRLTSRDWPASFLSGFPEFLIQTYQPQIHKPRKSVFEFLSFGLARSVSWILASVPGAAFALDTNKIPALKPPLPELPPTFWEAHGWPVVIGCALAVLVLVPLVRKGLRRLTPKPVPPEILARQGDPDDVATATEVARHLRRFTQAIFALPPGELTTQELLAAVGHANVLPASCRQLPIPADLLDALANLLRACDVRHFAPIPPVAASRLATGALKIADQLAAHRPSASASSAVVSESAGPPERP